jgi:signal transduction histidine kinase
MAIVIDSMNGSVRAYARWLVPAAWSVGLAIYLIALSTASAERALWINDLAWTIASACAASVSWRTARALPAHQQRAWYLITAACTSWLVGQLWWDYYQLVLDIRDPFPNFGQIFYSLYPVILVAALLRLPEARHSTPFTIQHLGNIGLITCCLVATTVIGLVEPALQSGQTVGYLWVGTLHSGVLATAFLVALYSLWSYRWNVSWLPMLLFVVATGIYSISNLFYSHAVVTGTYHPTHYINVSYVAVFAIVSWAAAEQLWSHVHPHVDPPHRILARERWMEAIVPALLIIIMVAVAIGSSAQFTPRVMAWSTSLFILFAVILGAREAWIQRDAQLLTNQLLNANRQLQAANAELRNGEARYRELAVELERRVAERTAQLGLAYEELEGFAYAVAHDLKAPLRAINSFAHLLRDDLGETLDPKSASHLERIRNGSLRMAALIDDLLSYSHIERRDLHATFVRLPQLVETIVSTYADEIQRRHVRVELCVAPLELTVDVEGLSLALRNLIENALKYTRDTAEPFIEITAQRNASGAVLCVSDNGIGFDMQFHDQIFKVFQRLHREDQYPGTGIGLALVRKAVERLGARVWAESAVGQGAKFFVQLPAAVVG